MGWKAFNLIATTREDGFLTQFPKLSPEKAREFLALLGGSYKYKGEATFEDGLYPQDPSDLYIGVYDHAIVLGSLPITEEAFTEKVCRVRLNARLVFCQAAAYLLSCFTALSVCMDMHGLKMED
jgi:hypothetical protein